MILLMHRVWYQFAISTGWENIDNFALRITVKTRNMPLHSFEFCTPISSSRTPLPVLQKLVKDSAKLFSLFFIRSIDCWNVLLRFLRTASSLSNFKSLQLKTDLSPFLTCDAFNSSYFYNLASYLFFLLVILRAVPIGLLRLAPWLILEGDGYTTNFFTFICSEVYW
jgi:hypothetical protein